MRVFSIDPKTSLLTESTPFSAPPGSGPRHGSFLVSGKKTYFFLVSELGNTVATYSLTYGPGTLEFTPIFSSGVFGNMPVPEGAAAAENVLSVGQPFIISPSM